SGLKQVDSAELGSLRTLRDIADRLQHVTRPSNTTTSAGRDAVSASAEPTAPAADSSAIADALVSVVAELTGYPSEAINLDMDLEADLGIDSIKRLEILSAMQKRDPALTAVESERLGALRTLRDILGEMGAGEPRSAPAACRADTSANGKCAAPGADADCESVLLEVVAELTGYPREAIRPDMDLESDLGIDSIKRLEILSATQRRLPGLAAVDAQELGALRTLADIVRQMGGVVETVSATSQPTLAQVGAWTRPQRRVPRVKPIDLTSSRDVRGVWLVIGDSDALGRAITSALANAGCDARLVGLADRADALANLDGAILIAPTGETSAEAAGVAARNAFSWAKRLASAMGDTAHATFACVSRLGGGFGIDGRADQTLGAAFPALAKTASREWRARCVAIDITDGGNTNGKAARRAVDVANRVMEVLGSAVEGEVGLTDSGPAAVELVDSALPDSNIALSANDVVVVSGGARGVTAASVVALAEAARCKFVLLGRSPLADSEPAWLAELNGEADIKRALFERLSNGAPATPAEVQRRFRATMAEREIRGTLARIHAAGGEAVYLAVDTRDAGAVTTALSAARSRFGPITALVHGAGVIEDARIADKSPDSFDRVFATKALGAESLLAATRDDPLRFLAFFSSVSARFGNAGQVDYAMANEYLNKLARAEKSRRPSARVVSINWGPWDGGMVDAALRGHFTRQGVELISLAGGAAAFVDELSALTDDVEVVIGAGFAPELPGEPGPTRQSIQTSVKVAQPAADMSLVFSRAVSLATDRYLSDHRIDGVPMMPVAMSVEWLAHAALLHGAGLRLCALARLRVHRGFDGRGAAELRVNASRLERVDRAFQTRLELRDADNHLCVSAIADMRDAIAEAPLAPGPLVGGAYPRSIADAYRDVLFHGPRFQAIAHLRAFSEDGIAADLRTIPAPANWLESPPRAAWVTCPFALDAALQLGLLWSHERQGAIGLPTGFGAYQQFVPAFPSRDVSIELRVRHADHISLNADIDILDGDGAVIARLSEVTWIVDRHGRAVVARQTASA
ncbi:MAG: SDR family NAD(P)-dependent oxidoreductase, partial [Phycisphaerales bacterium]|nr:SDR family NAD(P)-dependent oxidoreductase [Phycisphaerales bacterium]